MPGPPPVPTEIKRIRGNPGRYPLPQDEPKPPRGVPEAPEHLSEVARKAWEGFAAVLEGMNVLTQADQGSLEALCECYAEVVELRRDVALKGRLPSGREGGRGHRGAPPAGVHGVGGGRQAPPQLDARLDLVAWIIPFSINGLRCVRDGSSAQIRSIPGILSEIATESQLAELVNL